MQNSLNCDVKAKRDYPGSSFAPAFWACISDCLALGLSDIDDLGGRGLIPKSGTVRIDDSFQARNTEQ